MLTSSDIKNGTELIYENEPYVVLEANHKHIGRGGGLLTVQMKNLLNGNVITENIRASDRFKEAELTIHPVKYLYNHRDSFWFCDPEKPSERFELSQDILGQNAQYLKINMIVDAVEFDSKITSIRIPIKMDLEVKEAPPSIRGNTAQGGTKQAILETGAVVSVPLFIEQGDIITVNTQTGIYTERKQKAK